MWLALSPPNLSYRDEHLFVDLRQQVVILNGETLTLRPLEYRLLALLVEHAGKVLPKRILLMQVWGHAPDMRTRTVDVHIRRLRKKLGIYSQYIETVVGVGYGFRPPPAP